jgi:WD40 repeat protein
MTPGQLHDAVTPPGVEFEAGLVRRLIDDAGDEPGQLPLLEFTLDRLWTLREVGMLTHAAYDAVGGLSGAVAGYAGTVYDSLEPADRVRARRLLTRLAGPVDDGGFQRRPVRLADLDADLRPVLARLAASRLVVIGRTAAGEEIADLAHQALIRQWPRLRDWLAADRDFRLWQEDLRRGREAWEASARDPGGLLRGAPLATAQAWAADRGADLSDPDRAYLAASRTLERRRVRVLWSVIAVVSVLALLAGSLAVITVRRNDTIEAQLRTANSRRLADDSARFRTIDPPQALQLAQAAWRQDRTPEAYGALFTQYAGLQAVEKLFRDLWPHELTRMTLSRDGDVAAFSNDRGGAAVWTGLTGNQPQQIRFSDPTHRNVGGTAQLSPSGRYLGYANALGGVAVWDLTRPDAPIRLAEDRPAGSPAPDVVGSVAFSADEKRLLVLRHAFRGDRPELAAWEISGARPVRLPGGLGADLEPDRAWFGPSSEHIVLAIFGGVRVYQATTGRLVRNYPEPAAGNVDLVADHGATLISCRGTTLHVRDIVSGRDRRRMTVPQCGIGVTTDNSTSFVVIPEGGAGEGGASNAFATLIDPEGGRVYRIAAPPMALAAENGFGPIPGMAVYRRPDATPVVYLGDRQQLLYRIPAGTPVTAGARDAGLYVRGSTVTPDGAYLIRLQDSGRIDLHDARTDQLLTRVQAPRPPYISRFNGVWFGVTEDSTRLLVKHADQLVVYALPELTVRRRIDLPVPDLGPPPGIDGVSSSWATSILPGADDDVVVLHAGLFTRWDIGTGRAIGDAVPVRTGTRDDRRRAAQLYFATRRRPGHPDQVAVVTGDNVEVWSLAERRAITTVAVNTTRSGRAVVFNTDGSRFAVSGITGVTTVWSTENGAEQGLRIPTATDDQPLGFTPDGRLITISGSTSDTGVRLWDPKSGKQLMSLAAAPSSGIWQLSELSLRNIGGGLTRTFELDPDAWFRRLCELNDRPFEPRELRELSDTTPPCDG